MNTTTADTIPTNHAVADTRVVLRHRWPVRLMHWINAICLFVLIGSGLQIFNAHPALDWGQDSSFTNPPVAMRGATGADGQLHGSLKIGAHQFDTTGVLGASSVNGKLVARGFPTWATLPGEQNLALGRSWHFFFAWVLVLNGICFLLYAWFSHHASRDLLPTERDWRGFGRSIIDHLRFKHPLGEEALRYNILQKLVYISVIYVLAPVIVLMGLAMSPHLDSVLGWLVSLVGGRQSARTIHFIAAMGFVAFIAIHLFEVLISGVFNQLRSMITGRFAVHDALDNAPSAGFAAGNAVAPERSPAHTAPMPTGDRSHD